MKSRLMHFQKSTIDVFLPFFPLILKSSLGHLNVHASLYIGVTE